MKIRLVAALLALLPTACTQYSLIGPGRTTIEQLSVEPGAAWNRATGSLAGPSPETWTMDGPLLDSVTFLTGIADGKPLPLVRGASTDKLAPFHATMTANEIMDLFEATFSTATKTTVMATRDLRPVSFGGTDGFRFEASYAGANEVESEMVVVGAVRGGKLYMLIYRAARLHYFSQHLPEFETLVSSARLPGA